MPPLSNTAKYLKNPTLLFYRNYWTIGLIENFTAPKTIDQYRDTVTKNPITWIYPKNPRNFIADPFVTSYFGEPILFFERMDTKRNLGNISFVRVADIRKHPENPEKYFETALELDTHLSYPYMFEYEGNLYMVPENSGSHTISLYKAGNTPERWEKAAVLIDNFDGTDTNIFEYNGRWWMFSTHRTEDISTEMTDLYIWYADSPLGGWKEHPAAPLRYEDASARGAGTPFEMHGELYRPTQDCLESYGGKLNLKRITRLDLEHFSEETVLTLSGVKPCEHALHTYSFADNICFIDGQYRKFSLKHPWMFAKEFLTLIK